MGRDGAKGGILFRGRSIEEVWDCDYEEIAHLMVWGSVPSAEEKGKLKKELAIAAQEVPPAVAKTIRSFP